MYMFVLKKKVYKIMLRGRKRFERETSSYIFQNIAQKLRGRPLLMVPKLKGWGKEGTQWSSVKHSHWGHVDLLWYK